MWNAENNRIIWAEQQKVVLWHPAEVQTKKYWNWLMSSDRFLNLKIQDTFPTYEPNNYGEFLQISTVCCGKQL